MKKTKNESAYDSIKNLILQEKLDSGKLFSTSSLAERIDMGRAPVIDAIKRLENEGFVMIVPQQGIMIREMTVQEMRDINETRLVLEPYIIEHIAPGFTDSDAVEIERCIDEMEKCALDNKYYDFIVMDHKMHMYIYDLYHNACMVEILGKLRDRIFTVGFKIVARRVGRLATTVQEHKAILEALKKRDPEMAAEAMRTHLTNGWKLI
ncbi:GntR family transcriptional regulator [Dethiosulfovibrio sp. F2B]|uniref:GntR family transcriptional regulator n=1 Tax=Dethiosulfovibrio faecalis TaxID=2720018 RepID=UPI001F2B66A9|nr:GntR family transcriptional regulator [Dethiosulfovibrio faecalis]MCF4151903.1 GntR family transcriptional regulator [Dethiosulfovibrio faecalis]